MVLNHKILGKGTPVIILHGLFGMLDNWMSFAKKLAENYQVILVDHRNHGKSPKYDEISFPLFAQDVLQLVDRLNLEKVYLLGHSMGGKTVQFFASMFPLKTLGIISVDMGSHEYPAGGHTSIFDAILPIQLDEFERRADVDRFLANSIDDYAVRQFLLKNLGRNENGFYWKANFKVLHEQYDNLRVRVPDNVTYKGPALFVKGGLSPYIRPTDMSYSQSIFTNAKLLSIEGAGHWVHAQKPNDLLQVVIDFLE